jgi:hypothetical protein
MAMIVFSSPANLTGAEEKKMGPSRFKRLFFKSRIEVNSESSRNRVAVGNFCGR